MKNLLYALIGLGTLIAFSACESYVTNVKEPIDVIPDEELNNPDQVTFLISGVQGQFALVYGFAVEQAGGLSDELFFDTTLPEATFPQFRYIDEAAFPVTNEAVNNFFDALGELRFFADDLVQRVKNEITFDTPEEQALKQEALYMGHLYGGLARYLYAAYFGLEPKRGGGVIDVGPFIPSAQMYDRAIADFDSARASGFVKDGSYEARLLSSLTARAYLYKAHLTDNPTAAYQKAQQFAKEGLKKGDAPFQALYNVQAPNALFFGSGPGRIQFAVDSSYTTFDETVILSEPTPDLAAAALDTARVVLYEVPVENDAGEVIATFYEQALYLTRDAPIDVMTWQENALMLAELALRLESDEGRALELVNKVRASHSLDPLNSITLKGSGKNTIVAERRKELFVTGARVIDERRFDIFHSVPGPWRYLPITQRERLQNPNF